MRLQEMKERYEEIESPEATGRVLDGHNPDLWDWDIALKRFEEDIYSE